MEPQFDLLVKNGILVTADEVRELDIAVTNGVVAKIVPRGEIKGEEARKVIDAEGGWVMPGGIDAHVHLAEPQLFGKGRSADDYESGTRSAIAGGTTTVITFAPQHRTQPSLLAALDATHALAKDNCYCDYSFHLICANAGPQAISEFPELRERGISSLKIYMTYEALQLNDNSILDVLFAARAQRMLTLIHAENGSIIDWTIKKLEEKSLLAPRYHTTSHPPHAENEATYRAITFSDFLSVPILLVHVSSPTATQHIRAARTERHLSVYGETCPQYLFLSRKDLEKDGFEGAKCVCSPPPRDGPEDQEAIWKGLEDGTFTVLSSDHCPFLYESTEKGKKSAISEEHPDGHFKYIPNGIPGVETRLPLLMSAARLDARKFVQVTSTNAAKLYGLYPKKGEIAVGSDADLTVWYPEGRLQEFICKNEDLHHNVDYTPYEGKKLRQWPRYTVLRGKVVWDRDGGGILGNKGFGQFLNRGQCMIEDAWTEKEWQVEDF